MTVLEVAAHGRERSRASSLVASLAWWLLVVGVAALAFAARLLPVLRGGGLKGLGDYDDGVHYAAAAGLVHGRLPYRDFLFLHPPGIVLALTPFAELGRWLGDPTGFAAARLAWMALGAVNALLVMRILRGSGRSAMLLGGTFYAVFLPAVYGEHTTQLEGLATTCTLLALLWLGTSDSRQGWWPTAAAGAALGVSTSIKIWGVAAVVIALGWVWLAQPGSGRGGPRRASALLVGALTGATAVCLPFFLAAPATMFRMVVQDQLGRPFVHTSPVTRLTQIAGLPGHQSTVSPVLVVVLAGFAVLMGLAVIEPRARLAVALVVGLTALLMVTPAWFVHYASLIAGPVAVTVGFGGGQLIGRSRALHPALGAISIVALAAVVAGYTAPVASARFGETFPGAVLAADVRSTSGCVTTDNPTVLIEMNVLDRNLERGCPLVVDLGGRSYDIATATPLTRSDNPRWQHYALAYLRSGTVVIIARFGLGHGFSPATAQTVRRWPVVQRVGRFSLRTVTAGTASAHTN